MGRDRPVSRREEKGECNNEGEMDKKRGLFLFCFHEDKEKVERTERHRQGERK